ncbi:MAG: hypothetical protein U0075_16630 [Thermomicrobiales bacterium]
MLLTDLVYAILDPRIKVAVTGVELLSPMPSSLQPAHDELAA